MLPSVLQPPQTTSKKEKLIHNSCPFQVRILERTAATNVYPKLAFAGMTNLIHSCLTFMGLEGLVLDSPRYEKLRSVAVILQISHRCYPGGNHKLLGFRSRLSCPGDGLLMFSACGFSVVVKRNIIC